MVKEGIPINHGGERTQVFGETFFKSTLLQGQTQTVDILQIPAAASKHCGGYSIYCCVFYCSPLTFFTTLDQSLSPLLPSFLPSLPLLLSFSLPPAIWRPAKSSPDRFGKRFTTPEVIIRKGELLTIELWYINLSVFH